MEKKKILFTLSHAFSPHDGGVQRTTFKLGNYFTDKGFEVFYFSLARHGHASPQNGTLFFPGESIGRDLKSVSEYLTGVINDVKPDIVINQMPYEKIFRQVLPICKKKIGFLLLGCLRNSLFSFRSNAVDVIPRHTPSAFHKVLTSKPALSIIQHLHKVKHGNELREIIEAHDKFILLTPRNEDELKFFVKSYPQEKVFYIPNSIPFVLDENVSKEKIMLFVGNLNIHQKRADLLVPFWKVVYEKLPDWSFVIVGDGDQRQAMEQMIEEYRLPRIRLEGRCDPEKFYRKSSLFVMPSAYEGFPNVLLEAQSFGLVPIVINSYLALDWIVNEGKDAFFAKPFDVKEMAEKAIKLCMDKELLDTMSANALANARRFTIDKVGAEWLHLFRQEGVIQ